MLPHFWDHCFAFLDLKHSSLQNQGPGIRDQATAICWKVRLSPLNRSELQKQGIAASICNLHFSCTFSLWMLSLQPLFQALVSFRIKPAQLLFRGSKLSPPNEVSSKRCEAMICDSSTTFFTFLWSWPLSRPDPFSWLFCLLTVECWGRAPSPLRLNWTPKAVKQDSESADGDSDTIYSLSTPTPP